MTATMSIRQAEISEAFGRWIKRRTPPSSFAGDEQAEDDELSSLLSALISYAPQIGAGRWVEAITSKIEGQTKYRVWPSKGELIDACEEFNRRSSGPQSSSMPLARGDKTKLSHDRLFLLENTVLPNARRWVAEFPGLAAHGRQTLEYWGET